MKKIMVHAYLLKNLGDDLFIKVILDRYPNHRFRLLASKDYKEIFRSKKNIEVIPTDSIIIRGLRKVCRSIHRGDLFYRIISFGCEYNLFIGGSLFIENNDIVDQMNYYRDIISNGKKSFLCGANFGPHRTKQFLDFFDSYLDHFVDVCFREKKTYDMFSHKRNVRFAPDIVFSYPKSNTVRSKNNFESKKVLISVKFFEDNDIYLKKICEIIDVLLKNKYQVTVLSMCTFEKDNIVVDKIKYLFNDNSLLKYVYYETNIIDVLKEFESTDYVIATRYHAMILGLLNNKCILPLIYNVKMSNVLNDICFSGLQCDVENIVSLDGEKIIKYFEKNYISDVTTYLRMVQENFLALDCYLCKDRKDT